ncbi:hypothetical protein B0H19DRAFT_1177055 [Mycena capillaripes]|nr:hypothetical protein B0H19DRAFT_1177055 [Mycena capillaripes]
MDPSASEGPSSLLAEPMNTGDDAAVSGQRGSVVRHLAILSTLLVPIAALPYIITRRQVTTLRRRMDEMGATTALLKQRQAVGSVTPGMEPGAATALLTQMRHEMEAMRQQLERKDSERAESLSDITMDVIQLNEELDGIRSDISTATDANSASSSRLEIVDGGLHNLRKETESRWADVQDELRLLRGQQEALRSELFKISDEIQSVKTGPQSTELQRLLLETKQTRATFGAIGTSLGDIATIIHQVQIEMGHERSAGYDPVERLRILALQMQDQTPFQGERQKGRGRA